MVPAHPFGRPLLKTGVHPSEGGVLGALWWREAPWQGPWNAPLYPPHLQSLSSLPAARPLGCRICDPAFIFICLFLCPSDCDIPGSLGYSLHLQCGGWGSAQKPPVTPIPPGHQFGLRSESTSPSVLALGAGQGPQDSFLTTCQAREPGPLEPCQDGLGSGVSPGQLPPLSLVLFGDGEGLQEQQLGPCTGPKSSSQAWPLRALSLSSAWLH